MTKRKSRKIVAALSVAMVVAVAPATVLAGDYKLGISDKVKIKVQEWPDLTGEYAVNPDGVVSLPLIGNINVVGLNLSDLAREISDRVQRRSAAAERAFAAVEIAQYRPFAILGDVQRPGQYPYRPGLTVLEAISLAGGYYRADGSGQLRRDVALATGDINTQKAKLNRLIAHEARLKAVLDRREDIPLPPELAKLKDDPAVSAMLKNEQAALALENEMKRTEREAFEAVRSLYQNEIGSLRGQVEALSPEKESIGTQLNQLRAMAAKGLALSPSIFALERSLAQVSNEQMNAETAIVRANESITSAEQRVNQLQQERDLVNSKDLQQTRDELAEAHAKIGATTLLLDEMQIDAAAEARFSADGERPHFIILRRDGDRIKQLMADETTFVAPDDVIKIPTIRPPPAAPSSSINLSRVDPPER
jgi:protein involved in polysaccharide export with SLBB domain